MAAAAVALAGAGAANAAGGNYVFSGGTGVERAQVRGALAASSFDWNVVARQVTIHIGDFGGSHSLPGHVYLDSDLLAAGMFSWAVVQDEYAHQVDYVLFDGTTRAQLTSLLGGKAWCRDVRPGLRHSDYGCERFASTLVWAYWPSPKNAYRPRSAQDESASMEPSRFRSLVATLVAQRLPLVAA